MKKPKVGKPGGAKRVAEEAAKLRKQNVSKELSDALKKPDKFLTPDRIERLSATIAQDKRTIQVIAHYYGCDDFLELLVQVLLDASENTENISKETSDRYSYRATQINGLLEGDE